MTHVPEVANMARACIRTIAALDHELLDHAGEEAEVVKQCDKLVRLSVLTVL